MCSTASWWSPGRRAGSTSSCSPPAPRRSGRRAAESAAQTPAHFVAFDLLQLGEEVTMQLPYRRRRELLEDLFARQQLAAPWTLCPATTDPEQAQEWLSPEWAAVGIEGCLARTGRGWRGHRPDHLPHTVLLARYDPSGRMRLVARSTPLSRPLRREHRGPRAGERAPPARPPTGPRNIRVARRRPDQRSADPGELVAPGSVPL
ncbi:hypothetical protein [Streptomyces axinellae]|uniref:ATP-dependent DNA ligase n=1 Tax=Streptomyces axinellae TaxID=552788 RepID=UPI0031D93DB3